MDLERAEKRDSKTIKTKADEVSNVANPDDDSDEKELQELTTRFEQVCPHFSWNGGRGHIVPKESNLCDIFPNLNFEISQLKIILVFFNEKI